MQQAFDPLVVAQIVLAAGADIAFAFAMGAVLIGAGSGGSERLRIVRTALAAWIVVGALYLPLQASAMSGNTLADALPAIPLVIAEVTGPGDDLPPGPTVGPTWPSAAGR